MSVMIEQDWPFSTSSLALLYTEQQHIKRKVCLGCELAQLLQSFSDNMLFFLLEQFCKNNDEPDPYALCPPQLRPFPS